MSMDLGQLTQMTTWLDEEHRRDKAELIRLQQLVESQGAELEDQSRVMQELEGRIAGMQAQLLKHSQFERSLQQFKDEVVHMFAQADERRQQETREAERVRAIERDNLSKALNEIRRDLQRMPSMREEIEMRKAEQRRQGDILMTLQQEMGSLTQEVENKMRGLPFLEDGRRQDAKRIAQLQQESIESMKRIEQTASRVQMIEDMAQRHERETGEVKEIVSQVRASYREFAEGQLLEAEHLKRDLAEWIETMEIHVRRMDEHAARMQEFSERFREDRQVVENVERFQEIIRREQTQVAELQRLAEERQKRQIEEWSEESEKRWKKERLHWDHQWSEQSKRNQQVSEQFITVEDRLAHHRAEIDAAWRMFEAQINYQVQESRRWLGEMNRLIEQRPRKE